MAGIPRHTFDWYQADFEERGETAITDMMENDPAAFFSLIADIAPELVLSTIFLTGLISPVMHEELVTALKATRSKRHGEGTRR